MKAPHSVLLLLLIAILSGCKVKAPAEEDAAVSAITPVTVDSASTGPVTEYLELNGVSSYLKKNSVKSPAAGYINQIMVNIGDHVKKDQELFILKTKEATALDNSKLTGDSLFRFSGLIKIRSFQEGIISTFNRHVGDYVLDGDELCVVSDRSNFIFQLDVPYELHQYVKEGKNCEIVLPDKQVIQGIIQVNLPSMDLNSQVEGVVVKPITNLTLPENLIGRIRIVKNQKENALTLPKGAVLSNETQTEFWVMKLINDSTAVKVPIRKGLETTEVTEILSPVFTRTDRILTSGNYGLADTSRVLIQPAHP